MHAATSWAKILSGQVSLRCGRCWDDMNTAEGSEEHNDQYGSDTSAKDAQELMEKLRSAPAEQMVTEAFFMLLNGAQVKLWGETPGC